MGLSPALGNSCVPHQPNQQPTRRHRPDLFQFSTLCSLLCKGSNFASSEKTIGWPLCFHCLPVLQPAQAFREWNSVCIAVLVRMDFRSSSSPRCKKGVVVVLLVSLGVVNGAPALDRDLLTNQVCQFQVTNVVRAMSVMKVFTICNPEKTSRLTRMAVTIR